jgi:hypothetical protein
MAKIIDPDNLSDKATNDGSTSVYINTTNKTIRLNRTGSLSYDGVTIKALYSFLKEEWRNDPFTKNLAAFDFPMNPITDEFFEFVQGWQLSGSSARQLIRDGGFLTRNTSGNVTAHYAGIKTIGTVEANDQIYYNQTGSKAIFRFTGSVNEVLQIVSDPNGDGNYADGYNRTGSLQIFLREYDQLYDQADLDSIGVTSLVAPKVFAFALNTSADLKVSTVDNDITGSSPYTAIKVNYFSQSFSREVDSATKRNFGIVIDVGTHSGVDGQTTAGGAVLNTFQGHITGSTYIGGTVVVHEGPNQGSYAISGTPTATAVTITTTFPNLATTQSFTLQRATPVVATAEEIYEKVQWLLRQNFDIDTTKQVITGSIADELLEFVGDTLICGGSIPTNTHGGGSGVIIEGFQSSDTNRLTFYDNTGTTRTYPFVSVLTINFGDNLVADTSARYWVYFSTLPGANNDFNESGALLVDDNDGLKMSGSVAAQSSIQHTFDYDNNVQGGRSSGTDADVTVIGIGLNTGQYVKAVGTIERSTTNVVSLIASLERNYSNP